MWSYAEQQAFATSRPFQQTKTQFTRSEHMIIVKSLLIRSVFNATQTNTIEYIVVDDWNERTSRHEKCDDE